MLSLSVNSVFAQQEEDPTALRFREDQFYVGLHTRSIIFHFEQNDFPIVGSRFLAITHTDVASGQTRGWYSPQRFISNLDFARNDLLLRRIEILIMETLFSIEFRWRNATAESFSFWRFILEQRFRPREQISI